MLMNRSPEPRTNKVQVIDRAFDILDELAELRTGAGVTQLAGRLSLHKSTVHRLLAALERHRYVTRDVETATYRLGYRLFELGALAIPYGELHSVARPFVERLSKKTKETAHLGILLDGEILSIVNAETSQQVRTPGTVGRRTPLYCTSLGKAILAFLSEETAQDTIKRIRFRSKTENTIKTAAALRTELALTHERGYAVDDEEFEHGLRCVGAPVFNHTGDVVAALSVAGPIFRVTTAAIPTYAQAVVSVANQLSTALGFQGSVRKPGDTGEFAQPAGVNGASPNGPGRLRKS